MMYIRLAFILTFCCRSAFGQDYVLTTKQDSLVGKIIVLTFHNTDKVRITDAEKKKSEWLASNVLRMSINNESYKAVKTPTGYRIMKIAKPGILSLCYARQLEEAPYDIPYFVKNTGESLEVPKILFKVQTSSFLKECGDLKERITAGELGRKDLDKIIDEYNHCMERQTVKTTVAQSDPKLDAITEFRKKLEADPTVSEEAKEIVVDLYKKVQENKPAPNYLKDGLREALKNHPAHLADFEALLEAMK